MAKNQEREYFDNNLITSLNETLNHVNSWLQWAEIKHTAFLAANAAALFGWGSLIQEETWMNTDALSKGLCVLSVICLIISIFISIISFLPNMSKNTSKNEKEEPNLLFYKDCAMCSRKSYLDSFTSTHKFQEMFADEIIINSKIATRKYKLFRWTVVFCCASYATFAFELVRFIVCFN